MNYFSENRTNTELKNPLKGLIKLLAFILINLGSPLLQSEIASQVGNNFPVVLTIKAKPYDGFNYINVPRTKLIFLGLELSEF